MRKLFIVLGLIVLLGVALGSTDKENLKRNEKKPDEDEDEDERDFKSFMAKNGRKYKDEKEKAQRKEYFKNCK